MPQTGVTGAVRLRYFAVAVAMAAVAVPLLIAAPGPDVPASPIEFPWWALAAAFILTELFIVNIHVQRDTHTVSLGEIPFILGLAMASPMALLLGRVVGSTLILVVHRRQALHKIIFNGESSSSTRLSPSRPTDCSSPVGRRCPRRASAPDLLPCWRPWRLGSSR